MIKIIISIAVYALIATGTAVHLGCKTFKPVIIEGQPDDCNDFYSVLQYYSVHGKDSAFVGTVYTNCVGARKEANKEKIINCYKWNPENLEGFARCIK